MLLKELSKFIYVDEIRPDATAGEVYFLSHLLDAEMITVPKNWPSRIYTSQFIFEVLSKKKPRIRTKNFKILMPNVPIKLKSKEKTVMVTMYQTGEITNNVMYLFDDGEETHLYTGIFTEIGAISQNKHFLNCVNKVIDNVFIDTTRCKSKSYIFTEDTIEEIKEIAAQNERSKLGVVIPGFGYEKFLIYLAKAFPKEVYPTENQKMVLAKLGYQHLLSGSRTSRIQIFSPGITPDIIESNSMVTVYICEGKVPSTSAFGMYLRKWSPLPSLMDLRSLLDLIRPRNITPIRKVPLDENITLPASLEWFINKSKAGGDDVDAMSLESSEETESEAEHDSMCSIDSTVDFPSKTRLKGKKKSKNGTYTREHVGDYERFENRILNRKESNALRRSIKSYDLSLKRARIIRQLNEFEFADSDEN